MRKWWIRGIIVSLSLTLAGLGVWQGLRWVWPGKEAGKAVTKVKTGLIDEAAAQGAPMEAGGEAPVAPPTSFQFTRGQHDDGQVRQVASISDDAGPAEQPPARGGGTFLAPPVPEIAPAEASPEPPPANPYRSRLSAAAAAAMDDSAIAPPPAEAAPESLAPPPTQYADAAPGNPQQGGSSYGGSQYGGASLSAPVALAPQPAPPPSGGNYGSAAPQELSPPPTAYGSPAPAPVGLAAPPEAALENPPPAAMNDSPAYGSLGSSRSLASSRGLVPQDSPRGLEGAGVPGDARLEGPQSPALTIEKAAPPEIQVGKPAVFQLRVRNVGQAAATGVTVTDQVPRGTKLIDTAPKAAVEGASVVWQLGPLQPGDEAILSMQLMPQAEGEIGSVAQATFQTQASARTVSTRPLLTVEHTAPAKVLIGESFQVAITVGNPGSGAASGVTIEEDVPEAFTHAAGRELEYEVGTLRPGETRRLELTLTAARPGVVENVIVVRGEGNLAAEHRVRVEVVAPQLQVGVAGPKLRYLNRQATYTLSLANPGTASARDVEMVAMLPKGLKFVGTESEGQYDAAQHAVYWGLEELPANKSGAVKLTVLPVEPGEQKLRIESRAALGLTAASEQAVQVDSAAELVFTVMDQSDPIEVGSETTYEVRVTNIGSRAATNVRVAALMPAELKALGGEGAARATSDGRQVVFEPLARVNPQDEVIFKVHAQALAAGDQRVRVQVSSEEEPTPVTKEESTRVYVDR